MSFFGGYDPAKRVDFGGFILLEYIDGVLKQKGQGQWAGLNYKEQAEKILFVQQKYRMSRVVFDRSGVGDAASELFSKEIPLEPFITSNPNKIKLIDFVHSLLQNKKLIITDQKLYDQILEQEKYISQAGNELYRHPQNLHDDLFWALCYACYAARDVIQGIPKHKMSRTGRITAPTDDYDWVEM